MVLGAWAAADLICLSQLRRRRPQQGVARPGAEAPGAAGRQAAQMSRGQKCQATSLTRASLPPAGGASWGPRLPGQRW